MADYDDSELNQLLARGRLSGAEYDRVERQVLARVAPKPRRLWPVLAPLAAALCAGAVFLFGWRSTPIDGSETPPRFTPKGNGTVNGVVSAGCGGTDAGVCHLGDTLMFTVSGRTSGGFLVAYAERLDGPTGERIWYFPKASGAAPRIEASTGTLVLRDGIRLGAPHTRGRYRLTAWISDTPVERAALAATEPRATQQLTLDIE
jgi:hypothetical protein